MYLGVTRLDVATQDTQFSLEQLDADTELLNDYELSEEDEEELPGGYTAAPVGDFASDSQSGESDGEDATDSDEEEAQQVAKPPPRTSKSAAGGRGRGKALQGRGGRGPAGQKAWQGKPSKRKR